MEQSPLLSPHVFGFGAISETKKSRVVPFIATYERIERETYQSVKLNLNRQPAKFRYGHFAKNPRL